MSVTVTLMPYVKSYSTYSIHIVSWYTIQKNTLQSFKISCYTTCCTTLHYLPSTCFLTCYMAPIFFIWCLSVDTHTHTRHFTTKKIVGNVRRDSLVDLWHTPLGKCVAGIPLRPACHCCPWYIWSVRMGLPAWGNKTNHVWIYVFKQIVRLSKSQQNQIISHLYRCVSIYIYCITLYSTDRIGNWSCNRRHDCASGPWSKCIGHPWFFNVFISWPMGKIHP